MMGLLAFGLECLFCVYKQAGAKSTDPLSRSQIQIKIASTVYRIFLSLAGQVLGYLLPGADPGQVVGPSRAGLKPLFACMVRGKSG